ncbi:MAG TPA: PIN domain-containing protein [Stellaceae bacterium]|nr:PIN domain-containing protein [Stellaceae bacterium]
MIYVDSSVVLARLFAEPRSPPDRFWSEALISSRLLEYEVWNRVHARGMAPPYHDTTRELLEIVDLIELTRPVLARALEPFPVPVRTLDGLHLASMTSVRATGEPVQLASYDSRLIAAAQALGIPLAAL